MSWEFWAEVRAVRANRQAGDDTIPVVVATTKKVKTTKNHFYISLYPKDNCGIFPS